MGLKPVIFTGNWPKFYPLEYYLGMKTLVFAIFSLIFVLPASAKEAIDLKNTLKPFYTDGCTLFVDGPIDRPNLWRHCCVAHDLRYWFGGSNHDLDKTDLKLKSCVEKVAGPVWAEVIYQGVRLGHKSPIKNKTHWSWGWMIERENKGLNPIESLYVIEELKRLPMDREFIDSFILHNFPIIYVKN